MGYESLGHADCRRKDGTKIFGLIRALSVHHAGTSQRYKMDIRTLKSSVYKSEASSSVTSLLLGRDEIQDGARSVLHFPWASAIQDRKSRLLARSL